MQHYSTNCGLLFPCPTFLASLLQLHRCSIGLDVVCFMTSARLAHSIACFLFHFCLGILPSLFQESYNSFALGCQDTEAQRAAVSFCRAKLRCIFDTSAGAAAFRYFGWGSSFSIFRLGQQLFDIGANTRALLPLFAFGVSPLFRKCYRITAPSRLSIL